MDWNTIISIGSCLSSVAIAVIGWRALSTWKAQIKASRKTDFLDELNEATYGFATSVQKPIEMHKILRIGIWSRALGLEEQDELTVEDVFKYHRIQSNQQPIVLGAKIQPQLLDSLTTSTEHFARLSALLHKGQIYSLSDYNELVYHVQRMQWQHRRLDGLFRVFCLSNHNEQDARVRSSFRKIAEVSDKMMLRQLSRDYDKVVALIREEYNRVL